MDRNRHAGAGRVDPHPLTMGIAIPLISIIVLTALAAVVRVVSPVRVCPICAGVSGTWIWMLIAREFGRAADPIALAILMGGSVVGIAYQVDRRLASRPGLWFKALVIPAGFVGAYGAVIGAWTPALAGVGAASVIIASFAWSSRTTRSVDREIVAEAEKKLEDCCG